MRKPKVVKLYGRKPFCSQAYGNNWNTISAETKKRNNGRCVDCGTCEVPLHAHHIIPKTKGGTDHAFNLITLCETCHSKRHINNKFMRKGRCKFLIQ